MSRTMTDQEFYDYVSELNITDLRTLVDFTKSYYDDYLEALDKLGPENVTTNDAWVKFMIILGKYGMIFVDSLEMMLQVASEAENGSLKKVDKKTVSH